MAPQQIVRNNKTFTFFPDITSTNTTRGFLIDVGDPNLPAITKLWEQYTERPANQTAMWFSMYITNVLGTEGDMFFEAYLSLPNAQLYILGSSIPKTAQVIKKKKIATL